MGDTYTANIRVRDLPKDVDDALNAIASRQGRPKWEVVRQALIEYVERNNANC